MGTWTVPSTEGQVRKLRRLMGEPLSAQAAIDRLYPVIGDDALMDMIIKAEAVDPEADVRSLIAARLGEMLYLLAASSWHPALDEECRRDLVAVVEEELERLDPSDVIFRIGNFLTEENARERVAWACDMNEGQAAALESRPGPVPGSTNVFLRSRNWHVDGIYGTVCEVEPDLAYAYVDKVLAREAGTPTTCL